MATTPTTAPAASQPAAPATPAAAISTPALITTMVKFNARVSDLIISPYRPPQVELGGQLVVVPGLPVLSAQDTARLAADLIGANKRAADFLKKIFELTKNCAGVLLKDQTGRSEENALSPPLKERDTKARFQVAHLLGDGRLRYAQAFGRATEVARISHLEEIA